MKKKREKVSKKRRKKEKKREKERKREKRKKKERKREKNDTLSMLQCHKNQHKQISIIH